MSIRKQLSLQEAESRAASTYVPVTTLLSPRNDYAQPKFKAQFYQHVVDLSHSFSIAPADAAHLCDNETFGTLPYLRAYPNGVCYSNGADTRRMGVHMDVTMGWNLGNPIRNGEYLGGIRKFMRCTTRGLTLSRTCATCSLR